MKARLTFPRSTRRGLLDAQDHRCAICYGPLGLWDSHIDHIVPRIAGGTDDFSNLQLTHGSCNLSKGAGQMLRNQQRMPWA